MTAIYVVDQWAKAMDVDTPPPPTAGMSWAVVT